MANRLKLVCCLIAIASAGCAAPPRERLLDVSSGMPMEQVLDILGEPLRISYQEPYEAWLYEYKYMSGSKCSHSTPSQVLACDRRCLHAIVWFKRFEVIAVTGAKPDNVRYCGSGMTPIDWNHMPKSVD